MDKLTAAEPEPPAGTIIRDSCSGTWERGDSGWTRTDIDSDPESWTKVAGNYGPVTVLEWGES